jgi:hypothetical protein
MPLASVLSPGALTGPVGGRGGRRTTVYQCLGAWRASCRRPTRDDRRDTRGIAPIRADTRPESGSTDTGDTGQRAVQASGSWRQARQPAAARIDGRQAWSGLYVKPVPNLCAEQHIGHFRTDDTKQHAEDVASAMNWPMCNSEHRNSDTSVTVSPTWSLLIGWRLSVWSSGSSEP